MLKLLEPYKDKINLPVFFDFEYDTVNYAKKQGVTLGKEAFNAHTVAFCETIKAAGYTVHTTTWTICAGMWTLTGLANTSSGMLSMRPMRLHPAGQSGSTAAPTPSPDALGGLTSMCWRMQAC